MRIVLFLPSLTGGGAERVFLSLGKGFAELGHQVTLVEVAPSGVVPQYVPDAAIKQISFPSNSVSSSLPHLIRFLRRQEADILVSALPHLNCMLVLAKALSKVKTPLVITEHNQRSAVLANKLSIKESMLVPMSRWLYPHAQAIVCVSQGVADDLAHLLGLDRRTLKCIYNPIVDERIAIMSQIVPDHAWYGDNAIPVIIAAGRLMLQKDFPTLIKAFSIVRKSIAARLLILGEGMQRDALMAYRHELGLQADVDFSGFVENPYQYYAHSRMFVLSSRYEGFGNVIVEALACGTPVVSTDCPSGPREILENGKYGKLVPVGDAQSMADAILETLQEKPDRELLMGRAADFTIEKITQEYVGLFKNLLGKGAV